MENALKGHISGRTKKFTGGMLGKRNFIVGRWSSS
jgi:hypothetical protein